MAQIPSNSVRQGNPEDLHNIGKGSDTENKALSNFVNPGIPENGLVGKEARKTGEISSAASSALRTVADSMREPGLGSKQTSNNNV